MTTIAFDGRYLVADTAANIGGILTYTQKIHKVYISETRRYEMGFPADVGKHDLYYASCGIVSETVATLLWLEGGETKPTFANAPHGLGLIVEMRTGRVWIIETSLYVSETTAPIAAGSGMEFAMGALIAGMTAKQVINLAIENTVFAGLGFTFIDIEPPSIEADTI